MACTPENTLLAGWNEIGAAFGGRPSVLKEWIRDGAPVVMLGKDKPCSHAGELWRWLKETRGGVGDAVSAGMPKGRPAGADAPRREDLPACCPVCGAEGELVQAWRCGRCKASGEL